MVTGCGRLWSVFVMSLEVGITVQLVQYRLIMVNKCVAAGCSNTSSSSITLLKFPKDPKLRYEWEKQVLCTRCQ